MNRLLKLLLIVLPFSVVGQTNTSIEKEDLINAFKSLTVSKSKDFPREFKQTQELSESFLEQQKVKCSAKFTVVEIQEAGEVKRVDKPLSNEERELCYRELKLVQKEIVDLSFDARKSYAVKLHESFINSLDLERNRAKEALDKAFDKSRRSKRRSKRRRRKN